MSVKIDADLLERKLDRMKMNVQQMVIDAKKTGLDVEEKKRDLLSSLESGLETTGTYLEKFKNATAEQVDDAEEALQTAWVDLKKKFEQATSTPRD